MRDVVVIGAGVAGLTAATALSESGLDVVVVEARDRVGGRTHTVDVGGGAVDLGGAWVHDPHHNPLTPFLDSLGLEVVPDAMWGRGMRVFKRDSWLSTAATSTLLASLYNFDPSDTAGVTSDRYTDGIDRFVDAHVPAGVRDAVRSYLGQYAGAGVAGDHPSGISLSGLAAYEGEESGHNSVLVGGYRTLVDRLADGLEIVLGSPVADIRHTASEVSVSGPAVDIEARWAVVTVPLGVLRSGSPTFEPDLPASHRDAISRLGFKQLEKVVFTFDERFWHDDLTEIVLLDDPHGFISVRDLSGTSGVPTLVCFSNPTIAIEPLGDDHALDAWQELLGRMFGAVPDPSSVTMTNWASDPYSLGSYSYLPVGASVDDMHTLAEPVGPRVVLAGEHTVPAHYGTAQAAWLSGRRAASHIVDRSDSRSLRTTFEIAEPL